MLEAEQIMRLLILGVSAGATGVALFAAVRHTGDFRRVRRWWDFWFATLLYGLVGVVLLIGQLVYDSERIPLTWQAFAYGACLTMIAFGVIGLMVSNKPRTRLSD